MNRLHGILRLGIRQVWRTSSITGKLRLVRHRLSGIRIADFGLDHGVGHPRNLLVLPHDATLQARQCSSESMRCCFACRLCHGSRHKRYRIVPSQKTLISIRTSVTRYLISTCKIPANLPSNPRRRSPHRPLAPHGRSPESSSPFALRCSRARPVMSACAA
jgi:hypothetical protein